LGLGRLGLVVVRRKIFDVVVGFLVGKLLMDSKMKG
jgi:hypothetical protein